MGNQPQPSRRSQVAPFHAMEVMAEAAALEAQGRHVVHMEVGQPGAGAPAAGLARLSQAASDPLGYTVALGRDDFRRGVAALYQRWYGIELDPRRVIATTGSSAGFQLAFLGCFDPGARIAVADPSYPSYRNIVSALGLTLVRLEGAAESGYQTTPELLAAAAPIEGALIASPGNPTGAMLDRAALGAVAEACAAQSATLISDEIYHGLHYGAPAVTALSLDDDAIVINSFSKYFCMTGWRIGWMIAPERLVRTFERLAQNLFVCPPHASQLVALGALEAQDELESRRLAYARNRDRVLAALPRLGLGRAAPCDGAFYVYADTPTEGPGASGDGDSAAWCRAALHEAGVAITPGIDFDPVRGGRTARISFAGAEADVEEGIARLLAWRGA